MIVGSSGGGVLYTTLGFQGLLVVGSLLCLCGLGVLLADAMAWRRPVRSPAAATYTPSQSS
jgi:predicted MFS family arabinose efflux permease